MKIGYFILLLLLVGCEGPDYHLGTDLTHQEQVLVGEVAACWSGPFGDLTPACEEALSTVRIHSTSGQEFVELCYRDCDRTMYTTGDDWLFEDGGTGCPLGCLVETDVAVIVVLSTVDDFYRERLIKHEVLHLLESCQLNTFDMEHRIPIVWDEIAWCE